MNDMSEVELLRRRNADIWKLLGVALVAAGGSMTVTQALLADVTDHWTLEREDGLNDVTFRIVPAGGPSYHSRHSLGLGLDA